MGERELAVSWSDGLLNTVHTAIEGGGVPDSFSRGRPDVVVLTEAHGKLALFRGGDRGALVKGRLALDALARAAEERRQPRQRLRTVQREQDVLFAEINRLRAEGGGPTALLDEKLRRLEVEEAEILRAMRPSFEEVFSEADQTIASVREFLDRKR